MARSPALTPAERARIVALREAGLTPEEIALNVGRSPASVRRVPAAAGMPVLRIDRRRQHNHPWDPGDCRYPLPMVGRGPDGFPIPSLD